MLQKSSPQNPGLSYGQYCGWEPKHKFLDPDLLTRASAPSAHNPCAMEAGIMPAGGGVGMGAGGVGEQIP